MEDAGRVRVKVAACEGLCLVFWCVTGVVERIVGVLLLARSALFVHAITDGDSCCVETGPGGRCGQQPLGFSGRGSPPPWGSHRRGGTMGLPMGRIAVVAELLVGCGGVL